MLSLYAQSAVERWTLESLEDMAKDNSNKGPYKLGVKTPPKIKHIEVNDYVISVTHVGLGVNDDTITAFDDRVEARLVEVPTANEVMQTRRMPGQSDQR